MICGGVIWGVHFRSLEFLLVDFGTEMSVVMWCIGSIIDLGPPPPFRTRKTDRNPLQLEISGNSSAVIGQKKM
jgi:hypothetical protein